MKRTNPEERDSHHELHRDSLEKFIAQLPSDVEFKLHDWLKTLRTRQLRCIEEDALNCCDLNSPRLLPQTAAVDLAEIALMAYAAESCGEVPTDEDADCLEGLLIGLAVAACIERLQRIGWVTIIRKMGILLRDPRPYRVTQKGLLEGVWSHEPVTLWVLGTRLEIH